MNSEDESLSNDDGDIAEEGFCHFNENSAVREFTINLFGNDITIAQNPSISELGHGACVWDASIIFAKYVELNTKEFSVSMMTSKRVLELGSGCGLAGLSLMIQGADVTLTDLEVVTSQLTSLNATVVYRKFTGRGSMPVSIIRPKVTSIDWTKHADPDMDPILAGPYDIILLTDCVFSQALAFDLVSTIRKYSSVKTEVICCHEIRDEAANNAFLEELGLHFKIKRVANDKLHPEYRNNQVVIIKAKPIRKKVSNSY